MLTPAWWRGVGPVVVHTNGGVPCSVDERRTVVLTVNGVSTGMVPVGGALAEVAQACPMRAEVALSAARYAEVLLPTLSVVTVRADCL